MSFTDILLLMFGAILVENFIFAKFYGCCPFLGVSEKPDTALGMGMAVTFVEPRPIQPERKYWQESRMRTGM